MTHSIYNDHSNCNTQKKLVTPNFDILFKYNLINTLISCFLSCFYTSKTLINTTNTYFKNKNIQK